MAALGRLLLLWLLTISAPAESPGPSSRRTDLVLSEIMYKAADRADLRQLEFIELQNSGPFPLDLSGYQIDGSIRHTFASNTVLSPRTYLVVARAPNDLRFVYGITNVVGWPLTVSQTNVVGKITNIVTQTQTLPGTGEIKLTNPLGGKLLSVSYSDQPPWPPAADGGGHSLVLARPSYGEKNPAAWQASYWKGGSPGGPEPVVTNTAPTIVINEFLANTAAASNQWIEIYNHGRKTVNFSGFYLSDSLAKNKYRFPAGTLLAPRTAVTFSATTLGFNLDPLAGTLVLTDAANTRVWDAVRYDAQSADVTQGRWPDGAPSVQPLQAPTPGRPNAAPRLGDVIISELLPAPVRSPGNEAIASENEFVELYNRSDRPVRLDDWTLSGAASFRFPANSTIRPGEHLAISRNVVQLFLSTDKTITCTNLTGNYVGRLDDTTDEVRLTRPETILITKKTGVIETNRVQIPVDRVAYHTTGSGPWAHRGGASLELVDARSPGASGISQWRESDATQSNSWVSVNLTGTLGESWGPVERLDFQLNGAGECLVDQVRIRSQTNRGSAFTEHTVNGSLEDSAAGWVSEGNHRDSAWETATGYLSAHSVRLRATGPGDAAGNRLSAQFTPAIPPGWRYVITARVKWLRGGSVLTARLPNTRYGVDRSLSLKNPGGTPGQSASDHEPANAGPTISGVLTQPVLPAAQQGVVISARIADIDGLASASLLYRREPGTEYRRLELNDDGTAGDEFAGDGIYSGTLPGQPAGTVVAYRIVARDGQANAAETEFPGTAQDAFIRFGEDPLTADGFGSLRLWSPSLATAPALDSSPQAVTVVYGSERVIHQVQAHWSPPPATNGTTVTPGRLLLSFPADQPLLGAPEWSLWLPTDDRTLLRSASVEWLEAAAGLSHSHRRPLRLLLNGQAPAPLAESYQDVDDDFLEQWFPGRDQGDLFALTGWSEQTAPNSTPIFRQGFTLTNHLGDNPELTRAYYHQLAPLRLGESFETAYDRLQVLTAAAHGPTNSQFKSPFLALINEEQWWRWIAFRHAVGDVRSFGCREGRAGWAYNPLPGKWQLLSDPTVPTLNAPGTAGPSDDVLDELPPDEDGLRAFLQQPEQRSSYQRALAGVAQEALDPVRLHAWAAQRTALLRSAGFTVDSTADLEQWVQRRRAYLLSQSATAPGTFQVLTPSNQILTNNTIRLTGLGPGGMDKLRINDREVRLTWHTATEWSTTLVLAAGTNHLQFQAYDRQNLPLPHPVTRLDLVWLAPVESPVGAVVINEVHYNPLQNGTAFVELYNRSSLSGFDLTGWEFKGLNFAFPNGAFIPPRGYVVVVANHASFNNYYGSSIPVAGEFPGTLAIQGEVLRLIIPGPSSSRDIVVDKLAYSSSPPWPTQANGPGGSLQLLDPTQDRNSPFNWSDGSANLPAGHPPGFYPPTPGRPNLSVRQPLEIGQPPVTNSAPVVIQLPPVPRLRINEVQAQNLRSITNRFGESPPWIELFNYGSQPVSLTGTALANNAANTNTWAFPDGATLGPRGYLLVWADNHPERTSPGDYHASFSLAPTNGQVVLSWSLNGRPVVLDSLTYTGLTPGQSFGGATDGDSVDRVPLDNPRPGTTNTVPIELHINEWMPGNITFLRDEADGKYDDWVELYNASPVEVDLSGYYLSDSPTNHALWRIPDGFSIGPRRHRIIWTDNEPGQTQSGGDLHAGFSLSRSGETLILSAPDLKVIDTVTFGALADNQSGGRYPDGGPELQPFELASPGAPNAVRPPPPPPPPEPCLVAGATVSGSVSLWGAPPDVLSFWLVPGAPPGVTVDRLTGSFQWATPPDLAPGHQEFGILVCDIRPGSGTLSTTIAIDLQPRLRLLQAAPVNHEEFGITWEGPTCYPARLLFRPSLGTGTWELMGGKLQAQRGINHLRVPITARLGFYRLVYD